MTNRFANTSQHKAARVAGLMYLLIIITSILSLIFVDLKLFVQGNTAATIKNIMAHELLLRFDIAYEIIMYASVVILSVALYVTLKTVNKNLALLGLAWRLGEAILGCLTALSSFLVLLLLKSKDSSSVFETGQLQTLIGLFLDVNSAVIAIVFVFLSLGSIVFCYVFFTSRYIPRILAAFGIVAYLLTLIGTFVNIFFPFDAWMVFGAPTILFEIAIGFWLVLKGIHVEQPAIGESG